MMLVLRLIDILFITMPHYHVCSSYNNYTVKPPNKGHFGDNNNTGIIINLAVLSLISRVYNIIYSCLYIERLSSSRRFLMDRKYREL